MEWPQVITIRSFQELDLRHDFTSDPNAPLTALAVLGYLIFLWPPLGSRLFFPPRIENCSQLVGLGVTEKVCDTTLPNAGRRSGGSPWSMVYRTRAR